MRHSDLDHDHDRPRHSLARPGSIVLMHVVSFIAVVESGSVSGAARQLGYSQPAVSLHIKALEHAYRTPLFERTARPLVLTAAGEQLVEPARRILALVEDTRPLVLAAATAQAAPVDFRLPRQERHASGHERAGTDTGTPAPA